MAAGLTTYQIEKDSHVPLQIIESVILSVLKETSPCPYLSSSFLVAHLATLMLGHLASSCLHWMGDPLAELDFGTFSILRCTFVPTLCVCVCCVTGV
jgi:hypothetical protein